MIQAGDEVPPVEGLRARKRRETAQRITDAGMGLFLKKGYAETTLDDIAATAGISRRTFFYYFKSKDDILLSMQSGMGDMLAAALHAGPPAQNPLGAVRDAVLTVSARFPADEVIALDRVMRSSETVQARKQASYVQHEKTLLAALRERWPEPERATSLSLVAMMAIGAIRLSLDTLSREDGARPLVDILRETFDALERR